LYERFCLLATELKLPPWQADSMHDFFGELKRRLEKKALRLQKLLPGLSRQSSLDAISATCVMRNWSEAETAFGAVRTQQDLQDYAWELIDVLLGCFEPDPRDLPVTPVPRVSIRTFARRLEIALRIDAPTACQLVAKLFGATHWEALMGPSPFLPITEPIYSYRTDTVDGERYACLEPCHAARLADADFEAFSLLRQDIFQFDAAADEFVDRPGLLAAAAFGVAGHMIAGEYDIAESKAQSTLDASGASYPEHCRLPLAPDSRTHLLYIRVRAALYAALIYAGKDDEAEVERECLMARGREYRAEYERLLKEWAPRNATSRHKTVLKLVS
jgi:hypothetical protein